MTDIELVGRGGIVSNETTAFTYEVSSNPREFDNFKLGQEELPQGNNFYHIGDWRILPYGVNDNMPQVIKKTVQENATAPGMLEKKFMMEWGNGPYLYKEELEGNQPFRVLVDDKEIKAWLDKWDYEDYLIRCAVDYDYMKSAFTKIYRNKANRILGKDMIAKLEHVQLNDGRLACHVSSTSLKPTHIVETDFTLDTLDSLTGMKVYPMFDFRNPFKYPTSMYYANQYTFGDKWYSTPPIFGSLEWIKRSTATPIIFKAFSKNSINVKYHVESPQEFWDAQEEKIKERCSKTGEEFHDGLIEQYRQNFMRELLKVLSSEQNAGKVWHTRKILEVSNTNVLEHGWKITPIDQKIKDYISAHIQISDRADKALTVNIGLNEGISNTGESRKASGGSEQVYAFQNFKNSSTDIPELIICKVLNYALKVNFPDKNIKIGFSQTVTQRQQDISPKDRIVNQES